MADRWLISKNSDRRYRRFHSVRRAVISWWLIVFFLILSLTAEFWANSKPLVIGYGGSLYFPVLRDYHPSTFGQDGFVTDYRALDLNISSRWAVWPVIRWDPFESNLKLATYPSAPSSENWLGTDDRGRDVLARLLYGFRYSFGFAVSVWFFSYAIGIFTGATMGFCGGRVDLFGQRVVEVFDSLPYLLVLLTLVALLGASMPLLIVFSATLGWMRISSYMRAEFLRLRRREFVEAARAQGASSARNIFRHILPNSLSPLITFSPPEIAAHIYTLAVLDYLGLGLPVPTPSWGELLQQAQNYFTIAWWLALFPSMALIISLTALTFIGEGMRAAFDPRAHQ